MCSKNSRNSEFFDEAWRDDGGLYKKCVQLRTLSKISVRDWLDWFWPLGDIIYV